MKVINDWNVWLQQVIPEPYTCETIYRLYRSVLRQEYHEPFACFRHDRRMFVMADLSPLALVFDDYRQIGEFLDEVETRYCPGMTIEDCYERQVA